MFPSSNSGAHGAGAGIVFSVPALYSHPLYSAAESIDTSGNRHYSVFDRKQKRRTKNNSIVSVAWLVSPISTGVVSVVRNIFAVATQKFGVNREGAAPIRVSPRQYKDRIDRSIRQAGQFSARDPLFQLSIACRQ